MKVSVLIVTKNPNKEYLRQCIQSIPESVDQIVVAGIGFDYQEVQNMAKRYLSIATSALGITETTNRCVEHFVLGDYFCFMPDDDFFLEGIDDIVNEVKKGEADIYYFPSKHMVEDVMQEGTFDNDPNVTFEKNYKENRITGSAFISKKAFQFLEGYKGDICQDWDLWNRALKSGLKFKFIDKPGICFRFNGHSKQQRKAKEVGFDKLKESVHATTNAWEKKIC